MEKNVLNRGNKVPKNPNGRTHVSGVIKFIISNAALSWPKSEWSEQYFHVRTRTTKLSSHRPSEGQTACCPAILIFSFQLLHITLLKPCQVNQNIDRKISFPPFSHISSSQHGRVLLLAEETLLLSEWRAL